MNSQQLTISIILLIVLALFAWGRWRHDMVAMAALLMVVLTELVPVEQAFSGFSHPAVITVAAVLVISHALKNAGVVDLIASSLMRFTEHPILHIALLTVFVTIASAFMNNVGALALMLPVAIATATQNQRSPSLLLMPLAFGSILGGMTTMIGTPPNIIIANLRAELTDVHKPFALFDFSPVGIPVAFAGLLFIIFLGWRLLPKERLKQNAIDNLFNVGSYLTELRVLKDSSLIDQYLRAKMFDDDLEVRIVGLEKTEGKVSFVVANYKIQENDVLMVHGKAEELQPAMDKLKLELRSANQTPLKVPLDELSMFEGIISSRSPLVDRNVHYLRNESMHTLSLIGISRQGETLRKRLNDLYFKTGDILLLHGSEEERDNHINRFKLLPLAPRVLPSAQRRKAGISLLVFIATIALALFNIIPIYIVFLLAIFVYIMLNVLPVRRLYDEIDWPVIVLLGAMLPVGNALTTTGTTELIVQNISAVAGDYPLWVVITLVLVTTMFLSDIINNAATAVMMAPIAVGIAQQLNSFTDAFLMAVAIGASCAFLTPIGHQSNTLVMGPGGYRFYDYWRMGLPLELIIVLVAVPMIVMIWL